MRSTHSNLDRLNRLEPRPQRARIAGVDSHWWEYGPAEAEDLLVCVHGFRGDHHGLELFAAAWPERRMVIPDLPGFGETAALPGEHSIDGFVDWLRAFVEVVRPSGRLIVLGHSFGSIVVSAALAAGLPADGAILVNPISAPALHGPRGVLTRLAVGYYRAAAALPARLGGALLRNRAIVRLMSESMAKSSDPAMRRFVHEQHDRYFSNFADRDSLGQAFRTSVSHNVADYAERLRLPLLLVCAEHDDITPLPAQRALAERIPSAELRVIPGVGHLVHYETPGVAIEHMRDWWAKLS